MKKLIFLFIAATVLFSCEKDTFMDDAEEPQTKAAPKEMFTVNIENVSETFMFFKSGVFNIPVGANSPGPLMPGNSYSFSFHASKGHKLTFATMFVQSNDLFYGTSDSGLDLFDGNTPVTGDITDMIYLWDAGTEVNEEPGIGPNQPLRQGSPNTGADENGKVMMVNDGFSYPDVNQNIKVMLEYDGISEFTITVENLAGSNTPLAPGVWVVHNQMYALYENGMSDYGHGLEGLAEDGAAGPFGEYLTMHSGYVSPLAPGVWVVHNNNKVLFEENKADFGVGLQALAENGDPSSLAAWLDNEGFKSGIFNTPVGASGPGPLMPGESYSFSFEAKAGEYLSFASMLVHTNDLFFAPDQRGLELFKGKIPMEGTVTNYIKLWDAGTEVNEYPGAGIHQPARLNGGTAENGKVMMVSDGFTYPDVDQIIKVSIMKN